MVFLNRRGGMKIEILFPPKFRLLCGRFRGIPSAALLIDPPTCILKVLVGDQTEPTPTMAELQHASGEESVKRRKVSLLCIPVACGRRSGPSGLDLETTVADRQY